MYKEIHTIYQIMYAIHGESFLSIEVYVLTALLSFKKEKKGYIFQLRHSAVF